MVDVFDKQKVTALSQADLSKKGSVDEPILDLIQYINRSENFFTTSSCSGRICVFSPAEENLDSKKKQGRWLFVSHQAAREDRVLESLADCNGSASLKFEPFVLHVQCKTLQDAQDLLKAALTSGFRNSGIVIGKKGRIMMAVRGTLNLEVPLVNEGKMLVSERYVMYLVSLANGKMEQNLQRIQRFFVNLQHTLDTKKEENNESQGTTLCETTKNSTANHSTHSQAKGESNSEERDPEEIIECLSSFYDDT